MTQQREAFEAWATSWLEDDLPTVKRDLLERKGDTYSQAMMRVQWKVWQAAQAQATKRRIYPGGGDATAQATASGAVYGSKAGSIGLQTTAHMEEQPDGTLIPVDPSEMQATAEPYCTLHVAEDGSGRFSFRTSTTIPVGDTPLYTAPPDYERMSALADKWNLECDELREDNKRLAGLLKQVLEAVIEDRTEDAIEAIKKIL